MSPNTPSSSASRQHSPELALADRIVEGAIQLAWLDGLSEAEICRQMRVPRRQVSALLASHTHSSGNRRPGQIDA